MLAAITGWFDEVQNHSRLFGKKIISSHSDSDIRLFVTNMSMKICLLLCITTTVANVFDLFLYPADRYIYIFYIFCDLVVVVAMGLITYLHDNGYTQSSGMAFLIFTVLAITVFFDLPTLSNLLMLYALPVMASSFILSAGSSFFIACCAVLCYFLVWYFGGRTLEFSFINILTLFGMAALSWITARQFRMMISKLRWEESRLKAMLTLFQIQDEPLAAVIDHVIEAGVHLTQSEIGFVAFLDEHGNILNVHARSKMAFEMKQHVNLHPGYLEKHLLFIKETLQQRRPVINNDFLARDHDDPQLRALVDFIKTRKRPEAHGFVHRYLCVPIFDHNHIMAVMAVANKADAYDEGDSNQVSLILNQFWAMMQRKSMIEQLEQSNHELIEAYEETLTGWAHALEIRNKETHDHCERVTTLSVKLAQAMGWKGEELAHFKRGAMLHDIGKMGVPDSILQKNGPLNEQEWEIMRMHPSIALELLSQIKYLHQTLDIPYCHHERWDGKGYPRGLSGEEIPTAARIFAVVDVWDALSSNRLYRDAWPREKVIAYIREQSGRQFDPRIVDVFLSSVISGESEHT